MDNEKAFKVPGVNAKARLDLLLSGYRSHFKGRCRRGVRNPRVLVKAGSLHVGCLDIRF